MKLTQLAAKPTLVKITIDDEETITNYGDSLEFWVYDRQDLDSFVKLATLDSQSFDKIALLINKMILDEDGKPVVKDGLALPGDLMMKAIHKVIERLGKPQVLTSPTPPQK
jgi:hypothetical protein